MIGFLKGELLEGSDGRWLIGIGAPDALVGYSVNTPHRADYAGLLPGARVQLHIYTHVREDSLDLFGFLSASEKETFLALLGVNGIGPKVALGILSAADPASLLQAILTGDRKFLTALHGVGKKTAERMALELPDLIRKKMDAGLIPAIDRVAAGAGARSSRRGAPAGATSALMEARAGLIGLGYAEDVAAELLEGVHAEMGPSAKTEELIRAALKQTRPS